MDRRKFLAIGGVAAMAGAGVAAAAEDGTFVPSGKLLMRRIPSSGETIPAIGLGTSGAFEVGPDEVVRAPLREVLQAFFASGASLIDTSPMYSFAEGVLGDLLTTKQQTARIARFVLRAELEANVPRRALEPGSRAPSTKRKEEVTGVSTWRGLSG